MTLILSHDVPEGSLPESAMKEELSMSYLHMLASSCGLVVGTWSQDYDGKDTTLSSSVDYPGAYGPKIDVQLKCTGQESTDRSDTIAWSLDSRTYDILSRATRFTPALFCVLKIPQQVGHWLNLDEQGLLARSHMFYRWGHHFAPLKPGQHSQTVHLPKDNVLTPQSLLNLMEEASTWQPEMGFSTR